jgi:hypothetical protein
VQGIGQRLLLLGLFGAALCACSRNNVVEDQGPELLYGRGSSAMDSANYAGAIE